MSEAQSTTEESHTLFIVETDDLDDPELHQVVHAEHPPAALQTKFVREAVEEIRDEVSENSDETYRIVEEEHPPARAERLYEYHEERLEDADSAPNQEDSS